MAPKYASDTQLILKVRSHKTTLLLLLAPSSTVSNLKEEIAGALNDTSDPPRDVKPEDITVYKRIDRRWNQLGEEEKGGKRVREQTLDELNIRGVGSGSTVDDDGETLGYTVKNGLEEEQTMEIVPYPRDD